MRRSSPGRVIRRWERALRMHRGPLRQVRPLRLHALICSPEAPGPTARISSAREASDAVPAGETPYIGAPITALEKTTLEKPASARIEATAPPCFMQEVADRMMTGPLGDFVEGAQQPPPPEFPAMCPRPRCPGADLLCLEEERGYVVAHVSHARSLDRRRAAPTETTVNNSQRRRCERAFIGCARRAYGSFRPAFAAADTALDSRASTA